ncbi:hypothetical protein L4C37_16625 [Vibrio kagoshimensis]|uniref:TfuA-like protein n=1 Tax=Vibrio kagoshimensis TaxID=2910244 RepID=UPI003D218C88
MSVIIFSGPTLSAPDIKNILKADCRPPAKQGDIYLATYDQPNVIVLIDGYFENVPAVWHKEILYAMSIGIKVYGCSSMGALRAAELAHFGMQGFGDVFESYYTGVLEDDDEVALIHGPKELGYPQVSTPMVNIRATLEQAVERTILNQQESDHLIDSIKQLHYPKRSFSVLHDYAKQYLGDTKAQSLREFTENHSIDIKKRDAVTLLKQLSERPELLHPLKAENRHRFIPTDAWERLVSQLDHQRKLSTHFMTTEELHRELKLDGCFWDLKQQALSRKSALRTASIHNPTISDKQKQSALLELAFKQSAYTNQDLDFEHLATWLASQNISTHDFETLVSNESLFAWLNDNHQYFDSELIDLLKLNQRYSDYQSRITFKRDTQQLSLSELNINEQQLWGWFFSTKHSNSPTHNPQDLWPILGFTSYEELKTATMHDYQFYLQSGNHL